MTAFLPHEISSLFYFIALFLTVLCLGFFLSRKNIPAILVWILVMTAVITIDFIAWYEPAGFRMLVLIIILLQGMKAVSVRYSQVGKLYFDQWLIFSLGTVGMDAKPFTARSTGLWNKSLFFEGLVAIFTGASLMSILKMLDLNAVDLPVYLFWPYSLVLLLSLSLILHFGILKINIELLKYCGYAVRPVFKAPLKAKSLQEFWGKRWNLAFSEMTAAVAFKPLARRLNVKLALFLAFMLSGLLHEIALSFSVKAYYGWPMLYFFIHGLLMLSENLFFKRRKPGVVWVIACLLIPLPLLFHRVVLEEVFWRLI